MRSAEQPEASVVVVTGRDGERLRRCLDALDEARGDTTLELIVVLNRADEDVIDVARAPGVVDVVVESAEHLGFARAANLGRQQARGTFIVLAHDDMTVVPGAIATLLERLRARPDLGACGPLILATDGLIASAGPVLFANGHTRLPGAGASPDDERFLQPRASDYCGTSCLAIRAEAWDSVGGMEEALYPVGYADVDLALSLRRAGWVVWLDPAARAVHDQALGSSASPGFKAFCHQRNREIFLAKWTEEMSSFEPLDFDDEPGSITRAIARAAAREPLPGPLPRAPAATERVDEAALLRAYVSELERRSTDELEAVTAQLRDARAQLEEVAAWNAELSGQIRQLVAQSEELVATREELGARLADLDRQTRESALANEALTAELSRRGG